MQEFCNECNKMGITPEEPVPATDEFISNAQKQWYPDAPMKNIDKFTVENLSDGAKEVFKKPGIYAVTKPLKNMIANTFNGKSSVYFNPNMAFSSAKTLYLAMGHEFVHVSQYAALMGQSFNIYNSQFSDMLEFHAYSYQQNVLGDDFNMTSFTPDMIRQYARMPYFNDMSYTNFNWTGNTNFINPLIKK